VSTASQQPVLVSDALELVWQWDREGVTEFDGAMSFQNDTGTRAGSSAISYVADVWNGVPGIRLAATGLTGGDLYPVNVGSAALRAYNVLNVRIRAIGTGAAGAQVALFAADAAGVIRGCFFARSGGGSANQDFRCVRNDLSDTAVSSNCSTGAWDAATEAVGGGDYWFEFWRQAGANPATFAARLRAQEYGAGTPGFDAGGGHGAQFTLTDWNGVDMTRFGLCVYGSSGATGNVDFLDIALYKSRLDRS
jgi:hypothetical protein